MRSSSRSQSESFAEFFHSRFRNDLVYCSGYDDCVQRCYGLHVRILLRQDTTDQAQPKENLGRLHWRRIRNCHLRSCFLVLPLSLSVLCMSNRILRNCWKNSSWMRAKLLVPTPRIWNSYCKWKVHSSGILNSTTFDFRCREKLRLSLRCIHSYCIPCHWASSVLSSGLSVDFSRLDSKELLKSR